MGPQGQQWTTLEEMRSDGEYSNTIKQHERGLVGIGTTPKVAIGQRGLPVCSEQGNVLWDCITYPDDETYEAVKDSAASLPSPSLTHITIQVWWNGCSDSTPPSTCTRTTNNG